MAAMEFDSRSADRLPFHDPDEAEQALAAAPVPSRDAQRRHLRRVPLFSQFNEDELRRLELSRIVEVPMGTAVTQIGARRIRHHRRHRRGAPADSAPHGKRAER